MENFQEAYCGACPLRKPTKNEDFVDLGGCCVPSDIQMNLKSGDKWVKATSLQTAFTALESFKQEGLPFRIVAGNTGTGLSCY